MKDLLLIPIMLAVFAFGYYVITKVDRFIEENQRLIKDETRSGESKIRIAAESPALLGAVARALESCAEADPHLAFFLSSGKESRILEKLQAEEADIVLLADACRERPAGEYGALRIRCRKAAASPQIPAETAQEDAPILVVWKQSLRSKDRDRVIFALENEYLRPCGESAEGERAEKH